MLIHLQNGERERGIADITIFDHEISQKRNPSPALWQPVVHFMFGPSMKSIINIQLYIYDSSIHIIYTVIYDEQFS